MDDVAYRLLWEFSPRPMIVVQHGRAIAVNEAWCKLFERTPDEVKAQSMAELHAGTTKAGVKLAVELVFNTIPYADNTCELGFVFDIRPLAELEHRYKVLVEHSADGVILTDPLARITYMSPGAERILGVESGEIIGESGINRMHPEDVRNIVRALPGETVTNVHRTMHKDGKWRWVEAVTTNMSHDPAIASHVTNFRDITERHEADERLRRSEANNRTLIERLPTATLVHRAGKFIYVNPAAVAMLGWDRPSDLIGRPALELVHEEDRESLRVAMAQTMTSGSSDLMEVRMLRRNGSTVHVAGKAVLLDYDGEPTHVVLADDVTERRALFTRMAVADRMLSVGTLAAGVAHEINNPLAYVSANLQILATELPKILYGDGTLRFGPEELESVIADAQEGAVRVSAIVRDLRALARPEDHAQGPVDVLHVLAQSIKMTNNEMRHRARLVTAYQEVPPVNANASRLSQVFINLLTNAAHAIEDGHVERNEVRIRVTGDSERVHVEIEDTGVGIPASVLPRIFDPFFTTKPSGVGVGLGLSICDRIIESFGGAITVTSKLGFGTTFRVSLPVAAQLPLALDQEPALGAQPRTRILMIDDEAAVGRSIRLLLAPDHEVINVTRALEGLELLAAGERFDLILCDVMMPEMSGIELYSQLEARFPAYTERIVFMTGGAFTSQAREALETIGAPRLEKPFSEQQLRMLLAGVTVQTA
ncbi:MAG: PAS domain S-box protein [Kofleriaceae bacterium]